MILEHFPPLNNHLSAYYVVGHTAWRWRLRLDSDVKSWLPNSWL